MQGLHLFRRNPLVIPCLSTCAYRRTTNGLTITYYTYIHAFSNYMHLLGSKILCHALICVNIYDTHTFRSTVGPFYLIMCLPDRVYVQMQGGTCKIHLLVCAAR